MINYIFALKNLTKNYQIALIFKKLRPNSNIKKLENQLETFR